MPDNARDPEHKKMVTNLVETVVDSFVVQLTDAATGLGGSIDNAQIENIGETLKNSPELYAPVFKVVDRLTEQIIDKHIPKPSGSHHREQPLERVLIGRIQGLLPSNGNLGQGRVIVSRRALPGLFKTLESWVGKDLLESQQEACKQLLADHRTEKKGATDWAVIHRHPEINAAVDEILIAFADKFDKFDNRIGMMIKGINDRLAPAEEFLHEGDNVKSWKMDEASVRIMLRGLFSRFMAELNKDQGRDTLISQFSEEKIVAIEQLLDSLRGKGKKA